MQIIISVDLSDNKIPQQFRSKVLSLFKTVLTNYDDGRYMSLFYDKGIKQNGICFAVRLPRYTVAENYCFMLETPSIKIYLSIEDQLKALIMMSAIIGGVNKRINAGEMSFLIKQVRTLPEKNIALPYAVFRFLSALCLRIHKREGNIDRYVTVDDADFVEVFKDNLRRNLQAGHASLVPLVDELQADFSGMKRCVIKHYHASIPCSEGKILLLGNTELLNVIKNIHLGSRRSAGFGFVENIG